LINSLSLKMALARRRDAIFKETDASLEPFEAAGVDRPPDLRALHRSSGLDRQEQELTRGRDELRATIRKGGHRPRSIT
jgi:hypothetical protein